MTPPRKWITAAAITAAFLSLGAALDGPTQHEEAVDVAAEVRAVEKAAFHAALAREQAANPAGWTQEQKERARVAVELVVRR